MEGTHPLTDGDELLHRQVHPSFLQQGPVGSQAFRPTTKDQGQLSVSRGAMATAAEAFLLYTTELNLPSGGVWSVSVAECGAQDLPPIRTHCPPPSAIRLTPSSTSTAFPATARWNGRPNCWRSWRPLGAASIPRASAQQVRHRSPEERSSGLFRCMGDGVGGSEGRNSLPPFCSSPSR